MSSGCIDHWSAGKPRDEITVDFADVAGGALPCIYVPGEMSDYDYALTALPGEAPQVPLRQVR